MKKITESDSKYNDLEQMSVSDLLCNINSEDKLVAFAVEKQIPQINSLINVIIPKMNLGGRLFYIGSGTSGRLGVVDASECPPTFGVDSNLVIGLIAGGDSAIRKSIEYAEDDENLGWQDLLKYDINKNDIVIGIAASGSTPYVVGALRKSKEMEITTGCIVCNNKTPLSKVSDFPIEVIVGPEFITGSTRMKSGTAQKLVLNMISTSVMIKLGKVRGNKMVDMQLSNTKLVNRGLEILQNELDIDYNKSKILLEKYGSVRNVLINYNG
tara:strand:+ start:3198 stop:4004 length:807 start_codon:yes stop_codon:yes gene_type:complete